MFLYKRKWWSLKWCSKFLSFHPTELRLVASYEFISDPPILSSDYLFINCSFLWHLQHVKGKCDRVHLIQFYDLSVALGKVIWKEMWEIVRRIVLCLLCGGLTGCPWKVGSCGTMKNRVQNVPSSQISQQASYRIWNFQGSTEKLLNIAVLSFSAFTSPTLITPKLSLVNLILTLMFQLVNDLSHFCEVEASLHSNISNIIWLSIEVCRYDVTEMREKGWKMLIRSLGFISLIPVPQKCQSWGVPQPASLFFNLQ